MSIINQSPIEAMGIHVPKSGGAILRFDGVLARTGHQSQTTIYNQIKAGLFPKPVPIGARAVGWPDYEVEAINAARIAGKTDDEIRVLVEYLQGQRAIKFERLMGGMAADPAPAQAGNVRELRGS